MRLSPEASLQLINFPSDCEVGGFLLGKCKEEFNEVTTLLCISPTKHSAGSFFASAADLLKGLSTQDTELTALGIWHTHPMGGPWSFRDIQTNLQWGLLLDGAYSLLLCPDSHECLYISSTGDITPGHVTLANTDYNERRITHVYE